MLSANDSKLDTERRGRSAESTEPKAESQKPSLIALLGNPLEHSLSPRIHNSSFAKQGLGLHYFLCPCNEASLHIPIDLIRDGLFLGCNVTIPHKKNVIAHLDELSPSADFIQAVNTISRVENDDQIRLRGDNTDVIGFIRALDPFMDQLAKARILIMGTGGSARAVAFSLLTNFPEAQLRVSSRSMESAGSFVARFKDFSSGSEILPCTIDQVESADFDLIVNTTPLGMHPHSDASPCPPSWTFREGQIVYDLIYNPKETLLLAEAKKGGAVAINGMEMLIQQAAASYEIWTGRGMEIVGPGKNVGR